MKLNAIVFAGLVLLASAAVAQVRAPQVQPLQMATAAKPVDLQLNTPEAVAAREIAQLKRENARLQAENEQLKAQVQGYSVLGGSLVHAYCSAESTSANTAGASTDCGRYDCEKVTGTCLAQCANSDQCGAGYQCDADRQCKTAEEIQRNNDQG